MEGVKRFAAPMGTRSLYKGRIMVHSIIEVRSIGGTIHREASCDVSKVGID